MGYLYLFLCQTGNTDEKLALSTCYLWNECARLFACDGGCAAVLRGKEELASTKRRVYLMEEAAAAKSCQTTDTQSGMYDNVPDLFILLL